MNKDIANLLDELYAIEPSLRQEEPAIIELIEKLLAERPEPEFDEGFRQLLRQRLLTEFAEKSRRPAKRWAWWGRLSFALSGAALALIVAVPVTQRLTANQSAQGNERLTTADSALRLASGFNMVVPTDDRAFGPLTAASVAGAENSSSLAVAPQPTATGRGGGGMMTKSDAAMMPGIMPPYQPSVRYEFIYRGRDFELPGDVVRVLKVESALSTVFGGVGSDLSRSIGLNGFSDLSIENLALYENKPLGYMMTVNPRQGEIFLYQNWQTWPIEPAECRTLGCNPDRVTLAGFPEDDVLLQTAADYLRQIGVKTDGYGKPYVDDQWRRQQTDEGQVAWVPDQAMVRYPQLVEDLPIYDDFGNQVALDVSVNVSYLKVAGVSPLRYWNYRSSNYPAVTDVDLILAAARRGGPAAWSHADTEKTVEVELGEPQLAYLQRSVWQNSTMDLLLVPALVFPILNRPADAWFAQTRVVVPLVAEMLTGENVYPTPGPLLRGDGSVGMEVSAEPAVVTPPLALPSSL